MITSGGEASLVVHDKLTPELINPLTKKAAAAFFGRDNNEREFVCQVIKQKIRLLVDEKKSMTNVKFEFMDPVLGENIIFTILVNQGSSFWRHTYRLKNGDYPKRIDWISKLWTTLYYLGKILLGLVTYGGLGLSIASGNIPAITAFGALTTLGNFAANRALDYIDPNKSKSDKILYVRDKEEDYQTINNNYMKNISHDEDEDCRSDNDENYSPVRNYFRPQTAKKFEEVNYNCKNSYGRNIRPKKEVIIIENSDDVLEKKLDSIVNYRSSRWNTHENYSVSNFNDTYNRSRNFNTDSNYHTNRNYCWSYERKEPNYNPINLRNYTSQNARREKTVIGANYFRKPNTNQGCNNIITLSGRKFIIKNNINKPNFGRNNFVQTRLKIQVPERPKFNVRYSNLYL